MRLESGLMDQEKNPPRFRKTKTDKWAVMAPVADLEKAVAEGGKIEVLKKSGDWSSFTVASLGKPFDVDGTMMCYGYGPEEEGEADKSSSSAAPAKAPGPPAQAASLANAPQPDPYEPLPEYQGGADDEWNEF